MTELRSRFTFKSRENGDKIGYSFDRADLSNHTGFYGNPAQYLGQHCYQYDTYGDGSTQHSPDYLVGKEGLRDYWGSLAYHLVEHPEDIPIVEKEWPRGISTTTVAFFMKVKHDPNKKRWYCLATEKVSASEKKRHDKRWQEVPEWADGTTNAIYRFMIQSFHSFTDRLVRISQIRDAVANMTNSWDWVDYEELFGMKRLDTVERQVLQAIDSFVESFRALESAKGVVSCLDNNWRIKTDADDDV